MDRPNFIKYSLVLLMALFFITPAAFAGDPIPETDTYDSALFYFFDLRDRETYVQVTNVDRTDPVPPPGLVMGQDITLHIQIFDVSNNCNENNFFDVYTPNDSHTYNLRNIATNDGNPSGVVLPDGAYGVVSVVAVNSVGGELNFGQESLIGNLRIVDNNGYEYRTNAMSFISNVDVNNDASITFNFDNSKGAQLSDVVGITFRSNFDQGEFILSEINNTYFVADIDILNLNEVIFSCRNVIFSCTDQDNPLLEDLLDNAGLASVASFEYGINETIPHSKGGELLCPGNIIGSGTVSINRLESNNLFTTLVGFVGLNNGSDRGSIDSFWYTGLEIID